MKHEKNLKPETLFESFKRNGSKSGILGYLMYHKDNHNYDPAPKKLKNIED